ncbi:MAG: hypothetical protein D6812_06605, partial [Deltaproteobacteria bacterium]
MNPGGTGIGAVALFEWSYAWRNRRALVLLALYLLGAVGSALLFTHVIGKIENEVARALSVSPTRNPGAMTQSLLQDRKVREIMTALVQDEELARQLLDIPLFTLFYGWLSFTFVPLLVILTASEVVASDLRLGAQRFLLQRISRLAYALGKLAGQGLQLLILLLLSVLCTWVVGDLRMATFEPVKTAVTMVGFTLRVWIYALPFLGIALGSSLVTKTENGARSLALILFFALVALRGVSEYYLERVDLSLGVRQLWTTLVLFLPQEHRLTLWRPEWESLT